MSLWLVMPVFNEAASVGKALDAWLLAFRKHVPPSERGRVLVVDDGSTDATAGVLAARAAQNPEILIVKTARAGHGQSCLAGYRLALRMGAGWVMQIDADGQCDATHLETLWSQRRGKYAVLGHRAWREDGLARRALSRATSYVVKMATGTWLEDANTPYRLMRCDVLTAAVRGIPETFEMVNALVALRLAQQGAMAWALVGFRRRREGKRSLGPLRAVVRGARLFVQLRAFEGSQAERTRIQKTGDINTL